MRPCSILLALLLGLPSASATPSGGTSFQNIVSLGDSLLDDESGGGRSPLVSEHISEILGIPLTKLAVSGSTSTDVITGGQHTTAAANFGAGDVAFLWIGGNDFFANVLAITFGLYGWMDGLESNVDTIIGTLRAAGIDVVVFNLPDMAQIPAAQTSLPDFALPNATTASMMWRDRLNALAASHGATVIDIFALWQDLVSDPGDFVLGTNLPVLGPMFDTPENCPYCVFFDQIHPSVTAQGFVTNRTLDVMEAFFGMAPVDGLTEYDIYSLVATGNPGLATCFGRDCPCGNDDPFAGCANSTGMGALLGGAGTGSVSSDDLVLTATNCPAQNSGLFFGGDAFALPVLVGDGKGCAGGSNFRYFPGTVDAGGTFVKTSVVATAPPGFITAGTTKTFQAWTRDVLCGPPPTPCPTPCGNGNNLSNAYTVVFTP